MTHSVEHWPRTSDLETETSIIVPLPILRDGFMHRKECTENSPLWMTLPCEFKTLRPPPHVETRFEIPGQRGIYC